MIRKPLLLLSPVFAGVAIALGCWIYLSMPDKTVGAALFACGLLAVRIMGFDLFTGKAQFIPTPKYPWHFYPRTLLGNLIGAALMALLATAPIRGAAATVAAGKAAQTLVEAFLKGFACGMLMTIATHPKSPLFVSVMGVMAFILAGFNHCIADAFYLLAGGTLTWTWFATLLGNACGGALLGIPIERAPEGKNE